ncbi:hypothetical protein CRV01_06225 [Arcobacter sp. CECT 8983]|uniref:hypothetical protein n=1 Tax=Arcobacter sp. CECT 8983 TaxID=2044508 RepID=UPI00100A6974|nr:hypothetical protein [Arcobacter sp. CECT 8983]RXJ90743.1 hypothetical protein CRV01_06225 [Arcobacter sp. CECT 8983]
MKRILGIIGVSVLLVGCGNPKEANNENFEKVVNKYLLEKKDNLTCTKVGTRFPIKDDFGIYGNTYKKFVDSGLMKVDAEEYETKDFLSGEMKKKYKNSYDLTEKGKEHLNNGKFCFGTPVVTKVISFTEPTAFMDRTVSEIKYTYKLNDLPKWFNYNEDRKGKLLVFLTNEGWEYK